MSDDRLTVDDLVRCGICASGIRRWFTARGDDLPEGMTFRSFMEKGITFEQAEALNDGIVQRALAMKEAKRGQ